MIVRLARFVAYWELSHLPQAILADSEPGGPASRSATTAAE